MIGQKIPQDILSLNVCDVTSKVMLDLDSTCEVINDDLMTYNWEFNNSFSPNGLKTTTTTTTAKQSYSFNSIALIFIPIRP